MVSGEILSLRVANIMSRDVPTIGPEQRFYGYITGLGIENWHASGSPMPRRLFATFEYNGKSEIWIVPDEELFEILSSHLNKMACQ